MREMEEWRDRRLNEERGGKEGRKRRRKVVEWNEGEEWPREERRRKR